VARVTSTTSVPSTTTTTVAGPGTVAGTAGRAPGGTPTTAPPPNALSTQTLDQVAADLGALDNNLNSANSDLSHPQGDS
jgi:hypothetical protein